MAPFLVDKAHLPHEPHDRIFTCKIDTTKRLFVATEQTMILWYTGSGFFDLIVLDKLTGKFHRPRMPFSGQAVSPSR